jgi:ketosteroid isomerase-like protein
VDIQAEGEALMQLSREWSDLVEAGSLEAALAFWAEDAVMMPPGLPPLEGRAAIQGFIEGAREMPGFSISWEPLSVHVASSGDMAYMIERNVSTMDGPSGETITTHGKVVTIWRKDESGAWKNVVDMWNEAPPPAP